LTCAQPWDHGLFHPSKDCGLQPIPVMWALDYRDVGSRRSEATLVVHYSIQVAHMSQEDG
jgi:hypothetical protein